jgi:hypothetical protein
VRTALRDCSLIIFQNLVCISIVHSERRKNRKEALSKQQHSRINSTCLSKPFLSESIYCPHLFIVLTSTHSTKSRQMWK